jgi:hypothetical protein
MYLALLLSPVQVTVQYHQQGLKASVEVQVKLLVVTLRKAVDVSHQVAMALEHMLKRWRATGEPVKIPLQKTIRRAPRQKIFRAVLKPMKWLGRRTRCVRFLLAHEVGGSDAMESAMLAGASWSVMGTVLGIFSRFVRMDPGAPRLQVVPNYAAHAWRVETDCILRMRAGHAMFAGVWLLVRVLGNKEIRTWALHSWRRKGVEGSGRTSDPGPDEDGHGEP